MIAIETRMAARQELEPLPLLEGEQDDGAINKTLNDYVWRKPGKGFMALILIGMMGTGWLTFCIRSHGRSTSSTSSGGSESVTPER